MSKKRKLKADIISQPPKTPTPWSAWGVFPNGMLPEYGKTVFSSESSFWACSSRRWTGWLRFDVFAF